MTVDYTKISEQKTRPLEVQESNPQLPEQINTAPVNSAQNRICKQCYWIGQPRVMQHGTWAGFIFTAIFLTPVLLISKLFRASLAYMPITRFFISEDESEWKIFPELPYKLYGCRNCTHPDSMVPVNTREGQDALHWNVKKEKISKNEI